MPTTTAAIQAAVHSSISSSSWCSSSLVVVLELVITDGEGDSETDAGASGVAWIVENGTSETLGLADGAAGAGEVEGANREDDDGVSDAGTDADTELDAELAQELSPHSQHLVRMLHVHEPGHGNEPQLFTV